MNFGEILAKGSALFLKKNLPAVQQVFNAATPAEKAAFQSSVSESPEIPLQRYASLVVAGDWAPALAQLFADHGSVGARILLPRAGIVLKSWPAIPLTNDAAPRQAPFTLVGTGPHWPGRAATPYGSTILDLQFADTHGKIKLTGLGYFGIDGCTVTDTTNSAGYLVYTTNTTLMLSKNCFRGSANQGTACTQNAICLGGPNQVEGGGGIDDGFQGYGTVIESNYFDRIRRAVELRAFANSVAVRDNTVWTTCGDPSGAPFNVDCGYSGDVQANVGDTFSGNLVEVTNYKWAYRFAKAEQCMVVGGGVFDPIEGVTEAAVRIEADAAMGSHLIMIPYVAPSIATVSDANDKTSLILDPKSGISVGTNRKLMMRDAELRDNGSTWKSLMNAGQGGNMLIDSGPGGSYVKIKAARWVGVDWFGVERWKMDRAGWIADNPIGAGQYLVADLPAAGGVVRSGSTAYATNGRRSGQGAGAGTGCPVWFDGASWRTYYDNTVVAA